MSGTALDVGLKELRGVMGEIFDAKDDEKWTERKKALEAELDQRFLDFETKMGQAVRNAAEGGEGRIRFHPENKDHPYVAENWARIQSDRIKIAGRQSDTVEAKGAGLLFARLVRANLIANNKRHLDVRKVLKEWGDTWMIRDLDVRAEQVAGSVEKAMGADIFDTGGALIPEDYMATFIEALRPAVVTRAAGAVEIDMPNGNVTFSRQTGTSTLQYAPESSNVRATGLRFDQIRMVSKELRGVVPLANALLDNPSAAADVRVRNDLVQRLGEREDQAFLRGDGRLNSPLGMRFRGTSSDTSGASPDVNSGITLAAMVANLRHILTTFAERNVMMDSVVIFWNPRPRIAMQWIRGADSTGQDATFPFRTEIQGGSIGGIPWFETTAIPNNFAKPSSETGTLAGGRTEIIACKMNEFYIGDQTMAEMGFFPGGAYWDGNQVQSGISRGESVIAITSRHDCNLTRPEYCHSLVGIRY